MYDNAIILKITFFALLNVVFVLQEISKKKKNSNMQIYKFFYIIFLKQWLNVHLNVFI